MSRRLRELTALSLVGTVLLRVALEAELIEDFDAVLLLAHRRSLVGSDVAGLLRWGSGDGDMRVKDRGLVGVGSLEALEALGLVVKVDGLEVAAITLDGLRLLSLALLLAVKVAGECITVEVQGVDLATQLRRKIRNCKMSAAVSMDKTAADLPHLGCSEALGEKQVFQQSMESSSTRQASTQ